MYRAAGLDIYLALFLSFFLRYAAPKIRHIERSARILCHPLNHTNRPR